MADEERINSLEGVLNGTNLSVTQLNMSSRCARQFQFRYMEGLRVPPAGVMLMGTAGHKAIEHNLVGIMAEMPPTIEEVMDSYSDAFAEAVDGAGEFTLDEGDNIGSIKDAGAGMVATHTRDLAPILAPIAVEERFEVVLDSSLPPILGFIDIIEAGTVRDTKMKRQKRRTAPRQDDLNADLQLQMYRRVSNVMVAVQDCCFSVNGKTDVESFFVEEEWPEWFLLQIVAGCHEAIRAGAFPPQPKGWHCSPKFCGYYSRCRGKR